MKIKKILTIILSCAMVLTTMILNPVDVHATGDIQYYMYIGLGWDRLNTISVYSASDPAATFDINNIYIDDEKVEKVNYVYTKTEFHDSLEGKIDFNEKFLETLHDGKNHKLYVEFSDGYSKTLDYLVKVNYFAEGKKVFYPGEEVVVKFSSDSENAIYDLVEIQMGNNVLSSDDYTIVDENKMVLNSDFIESLSKNKDNKIWIYFSDGDPIEYDFALIDKSYSLNFSLSSDKINYQNHSFQVYKNGEYLNYVDGSIDGSIDMTEYAKKNLPLYIRFDPNEFGKVNSLTLYVEKEGYLNWREKNQKSSSNKLKEVRAINPEGWNVNLDVKFDGNEIILSPEMVSSFGDECRGRIRVIYDSDDGTTLESPCIYLSSTYPEIIFGDPNYPNPAYPWDIIYDNSHNIDILSRDHFSLNGKVQSSMFEYDGFKSSFDAKCDKFGNYEIVGFDKNTEPFQALNKKTGELETIKVKYTLNLETTIVDGVKHHSVIFTQLRGQREFYEVDLSDYDTCFSNIELDVPYTWIGSIEKESMDVKVSDTLDKVGNGWQPQITLIDGSYTLVEGKDYGIQYINNTKPGTAQAVITGMGDYSGTRTIDYTIKGNSFKDVKENDWFYSSVQYVSERGMMSGYDGLFTPQGNMTRSMIVSTLYRLAGSPEVTDKTAETIFSDVETGKWYTDAVNWAYSTGVSVGYPDVKRFGTNDNVTREQLAVFLYKYAEKTGLDVSARKDLSEYKGYKEVSGYAKEAMSWATATGMISGMKSEENGEVVYYLMPKGKATRAQFASILMRYCEYYNLN